MSKLTDEADAVVEKLNLIEYGPDVSVQNYEEMIKRAAALLAELSWMYKDLET